ncbi:Dual specificity protein phosphatase 23 [Phytophthora nicotianae]|uniref:Dual specificity protein phosphatase 23 n=1 Tax=Phytophthora nicotianae TaxID=4792 RepID=A0A0W8DGR3_PHYNI|nr:Dual specificity protein phosphatase 23 [Phytophthora nicotianae]
MMATPFATAPSASLVVRREKRRRRKATGPSDSERRPRRGFKFSDKKDEDNNEGPAEATPVGKRKPGTPAKDNTFVFRVRKDDEKDVGKQHAVDAAAVSAALRAKQEKAARAEMRRLVRQKKREEATREALNEEEMKHKKLSLTRSRSTTWCSVR